MLHTTFHQPSPTTCLPLVEATTLRSLLEVPSLWGYPCHLSTYLKHVTCGDIHLEKSYERPFSNPTCISRGSSAACQPRTFITSQQVSFPLVVHCVISNPPIVVCCCYLSPQHHSNPTETSALKTCFLTSTINFFHQLRTVWTTWLLLVSLTT